MKHSFQIKLEAVKCYLSGYFEKQVTEIYGINRTDLFVWVERYRQHGEDGLKRHAYTKANTQLRLQIVSEHLIESVSLTELIVEMNLYGKRKMTKYKSYKGEIGKIAPNVIDRDFIATAPNQKLRKYIRYYNNERIKLRLNGKSPVQYRALFQSKSAS